MDNNVAKILSKKLKRVNRDLVNAKSQVHNLKAKRKEIQDSLTKEKRKNSTLSNLNQTSLKSLVIPSKSSLGNLDEKPEVPVYRSQTSLSLSTSPIKRGKLMKVLEVAESPEFTRKNSQEESLILDQKLNQPESDISFREDKNLYSKKTWTDSEVSSGQNIANTITSLGNFDKNDRMNSGRGSRKKLTFTESVERWNSKTTTSAGSRELDRGGSEGFLSSDRTAKSILREGDPKLRKLYERNFVNNSHGRFEMKFERLAAK